MVLVAPPPLLPLPAPDPGLLLLDTAAFTVPLFSATTVAAVALNLGGLLTEQGLYAEALGASERRQFN